MDKLVFITAVPGQPVVEAPARNNSRLAEGLGEENKSTPLGTVKHLRPAHSKNPLPQHVKPGIEISWLESQLEERQQNSPRLPQSPRRQITPVAVVTPNSRQSELSRLLEEVRKKTPHSKSQNPESASSQLFMPTRRGDANRRLRDGSSNPLNLPPSIRSETAPVSTGFMPLDREDLPYQRPRSRIVLGEPPKHFQDELSEPENDDDKASKSDVGSDIGAVDCDELLALDQVRIAEVNSRDPSPRGVALTLNRLNLAEIARSPDSRETVDGSLRDLFRQNNQEIGGVYNEMLLSDSSTESEDEGNPCINDEVDIHESSMANPIVPAE